MKMLGFLRDLEPRATAPLPTISELREKLPTERVAGVVAYLQAGEIVSDAMGVFVDPLDPSAYVLGGAGLQTDGVWAWRQDLWHYVSRYRIGLPEEFLERVLGGYQPPTEVKHQAILDARNIVLQGS